MTNWPQPPHDAPCSIGATAKGGTMIPCTLGRLLAALSLLALVACSGLPLAPTELPTPHIMGTPPTPVPSEMPMETPQPNGHTPDSARFYS